MLKYQQKITEKQLDETKLSKTIKTNIRTFEQLRSDVEAQLSQLREELADADEARQAEINELIVELQTDVANADEELTAQIDKYARLLPMYVKKGEMLLQKKKDKNNNHNHPAPVQPLNEPAPPPTPTPANEPNQPNEPNPPAPNPPAPPVNEPNPPAPTPAAEPKKKSDTGWWIVAGLVAVVTVGAVILRKRD